MSISIGYMWKAVVAGLGAAVTSVTAIEASGGMTWESLAIAAMGAIGTALATFAKANAPMPGQDGQPKPEGSQNIPDYQPPEATAPASGLPTAFPLP